MTKEEICAYATACAEVFCRERKIDEQDQADYVQEGITVALGRAQAAPDLNKAYVSATVQGALQDYLGKQRNEGIGGRHASGYEHVSLAETVTGAVDEEGEPVTYGDLLAYAEPPEGLEDPTEAVELTHDVARMRAAIRTLPQGDQHFLEVAALSGKTQAEAANVLGVTQQAVEQRLVRMVRRLQIILQ